MRALISTTLALALLASPGRAQRAPDPEGDALALARLTAHEAGLESLPDAALIHAVLRGIQARDGVSYARAIALASPRWSRCDTPRRWTCGLRADGERPAWWRGASWERARPAWLRLLEHARAVVRGDVASPCEREPRVWGSTADRDRGVRRGSVWLDAGCRGTRNVGGAWGR